MFNIAQNFFQVFKFFFSKCYILVHFCISERRGAPKHHGARGSLLRYSTLSTGLETHLPCNGIYNNYIIAIYLQSLSVKEFLKLVKLVNNWRRYGQK